MRQKIIVPQGRAIFPDLPRGTRVQATAGLKQVDGKFRLEIEDVKRGYGLHPTVWRALRAKHPGMDLTAYDHAGRSLGIIYLGRYESMVYMRSSLDFRAVSWRQTINRAEADSSALLGPNRIPIGHSTWGY